MFLCGSKADAENNFIKTMAALLECKCVIFPHNYNKCSKRKVLIWLYSHLCFLKIV